MNTHSHQAKKAGHSPGQVRDEQHACDWCGGIDFNIGLDRQMEAFEYTCVRCGQKHYRERVEVRRNG